jgi:hypothetical protein
MGRLEESVLVLKLLGNVEWFWDYYEVSPIWDKPISHDSFLTAQPLIQIVNILPVAIMFNSPPTFPPVLHLTYHSLLSALVIAC